MRDGFDGALRALKKLAGVAATMLVLNSCFVPEQYEAEIRFTKLGAYGISYTGVLTQAPLFGELARGNVKDTDPSTAESIKGYTNQLKRDSSFKEVRSIGRG